MEERIWTSRKFTSAWAVTVLVSGLLFGPLESGSYATIMSFVWAAYFAANVGSKLVPK